VEALLLALGDAAYELTITNSKKSTGHTMGVGVEDAIAVFSLQAGVAPSIDIGKVSDKYKKFKFSQGPVSTLRYALHLACGIGSHIAVVLYGIAD
jgi:3-oxoacyl-(acyl-carrier-protein) synthase